MASLSSARGSKFNYLVRLRRAVQRARRIAGAQVSHMDMWELDEIETEIDAVEERLANAIDTYMANQFADYNSRR